MRLVGCVESVVLWSATALKSEVKNSSGPARSLMSRKQSSLRLRALSALSAAIAASRWEFDARSADDFASKRNEAAATKNSRGRAYGANFFVRRLQQLELVLIWQRWREFA